MCPEKSKYYFLIIFLLTGVILFSQSNEKIFINDDTILNTLFSKITINNKGNLCITMCNSGQRFLMYIDDTSEPIVSNYNNTYEIKKNIRISNKNGLKLTIASVKTNHWKYTKRQRDQSKASLAEYIGMFQTNNNTIHWLKKEEFMILKSELKF